MQFRVQFHLNCLIRPTPVSIAPYSIAAGQMQAQLGQEAVYSSSSGSGGGLAGASPRATQRPQTKKRFEGPGGPSEVQS